MASIVAFAYCSQWIAFMAMPKIRQDDNIQIFQGHPRSFIIALLDSYSLSIRFGIPWEAVSRINRHKQTLALAAQETRWPLLRT
jgi:hypothetical protein